MANDYFNNTRSFTPGTQAKGDEVDDKFDAVGSGFDQIGTGISTSIKLTNLDGATPEITGDAVTRANKVIAFDASGYLTLKNQSVRFRGDWAPATLYAVNDIAIDAAGAVGLDNVYICVTEHTSGSLAAEIANWELLIDVVTVVAAETAAVQAASDASGFADDASGHAATAGGHATTAGGHATTAGGHATTAGGHATTAGGHATAAETAKGLAEQWASDPEDSVVADGKYSAYHWAQKAEAVAGSVDHGALVGLGDNDHPQYLLAAGYTAADVLTKIKTVDGSGSGLDADLLDGQQGSYYLPASGYTAADVLAKIKTVDGAGSGLDADTVDGLQASQFLLAATFDPIAQMQYAAGQGYMLPNWDTTFTPAAEPTVIEMIEDGGTGHKMKWAITYTSGDPTQIVWSYDSGSGYAVLAGGTQTITYDGSGDITGVTSA